MHIFTSRLFHVGLEGLEDLKKSASVDRNLGNTYLKLNLGLGNVLLAATAVGDLLGFGDLVTNGLK